MSKPVDAGAPPPAYTQAATETSHLQQAPHGGGTFPNEPPPQYEGPKAGMQQGYQSAYPPQGTYPAVPVATQPVIVQARSLGPHSCTTECVYCHATVSTSVTYEPGTLTWIGAGVICLMGCWLGCCLIPFCINDMADVIHHCPNCNQKIGVFRRLS